jgi:hypothetical protein
MKLRACIVPLVGLFLGGMHSPATAQSSTGTFKGEIVVTMLSDGRNMKLLQPFSFVDSKGKSWDVPAGEQTDGASIPRVFWATHPPFTGTYRSAAVIHDYYCRVQSRPWQATHNVFFEAMRAAGVDERTATVLWGAVYNFGPRWGQGSRRRGGSTSSRPEDQAEFMNRLDVWITRNNPSREEIASAIDRGSVPAR